MSLAAAGGSDGGDDGDKKGKGLAHGHEEEEWSPIRTNPVVSSDSDDDDDDNNAPTLKRKLSPSPRPGSSKYYLWASKSFGGSVEEEHPANKKRRLEIAERLKLEEVLPGNAVDQAAADEVLPDADAENTDEEDKMEQ